MSDEKHEKHETDDNNNPGMITRSSGMEILSAVLQDQKTCELIEKTVCSSKQEKETEQHHIAEPRSACFQIAGQLLQNPPSEHKTIIQDIVQNGKYGWNSRMYDAVASRIAEHDDYIVHPFDVVAGVGECPKCGCKRLWNVQKQVRASDEPMTTFSQCVDCSHKWTYSG